MRIIIISSPTGTHWYKNKIDKVYDIVLNHDGTPHITRSVTGSLYTVYIKYGYRYTGVYVNDCLLLEDRI